MGLDQRVYWKNERIAFLALTTLKGVGFWTLHQLATSRVGFKNVFKNHLNNYVKLEEGSLTPLPEIKKKLWRRGIKILNDLTKENVVLVFHDEGHFPSKLKSIPDSPQWIFVQGNLSVLETPAVAIVGTRRPSDDGLFLTKLVVAALHKSKYATVSGLALGIDQLAHVESVRYGLPTIAVLGTGINESYPKGSESLRRQILDNGGAVITEYLPAQSYSSENFVRRNRIQAALADVLVPVEWKVKSGTAHTVGFAAKYNRKIINLYLPETAATRPEIDYARTMYAARDFEVPLGIADFLGELAKPSEERPAQTTRPITQLGLLL